ncbi:MAG: efflux RND transporter permease subunit, partial [Planctomycetes bacterium]|nr:efflux RND transporter permease subunit [Planctomycetota bacterium]
YFGFLVWGAVVTFGASTILTPLYGDEPTSIRPLAMLDEHYPGFGSEFMPPLDEGSLLFMPSTLSQAGIGETLKVMEWQNEQIVKVPEVTQAVGKLGRAETSLDPAPIGMIETVVNLKPKKYWRKAVPQEQLVKKLRHTWHENDLMREMREGATKQAIHDAMNDGLTLDELANQVEIAEDIDILRGLREEGKPLTLGGQLIVNLGRDLTQKSLIADLRQVTRQPGVAPSWLQPIETRIVMLSSGIKARIGLELVGSDAAELSELALKLEPIVKEVEGTSDVTALRIGGKPYIEFHINRERMQHYGVNIEQVNNIIKIAQGGMRVTTTVEGRERYPVRIRYERDRRDSIEKLGDLLVTTKTGAQIPITEVADIKHVLGPAAIRGINGQLVGYVMFNAVDIDEVTLIDRVEERVQRAKRDGEVDWPKGYSYRWVGQYKEAIKAAERLSYIIPIALLMILLLVFLHFKQFSTTIIVFLGVPLGTAGGMVLVRYWPWLQHLITGDPQGPAIYMTVAVVVGFIALLGIIVDDGVVIGTYIQQLYQKKKPKTKEEIRLVVIEAGSRRIRPTLMTTITTTVALAPVLLSTGRGSDVMQPMALPVIGGMTIAIITLFIVPTAMSFWLELKINKEGNENV